MASQTQSPALMGLTGMARRLVFDGILPEADARRAVQESAKQRVPLATWLVEHGMVDSTRMAQITSAEFGIPLMNVSAMDLAQMPLDVIAESMISKHQALPLFRRGKRLFVGIADPMQSHALDEIKFHSNWIVEPVLVERAQLERTIEHALNSMSTTIDGLDDDEALDGLALEAGDGDSAESALGSGVDATGGDDTPVVKFVNKVLLDAIKRGASDIHFEPYETQYRVRLRMDGILRTVAKAPIQLGNRIASRLKVMSGLDIAERRVPQDGRIKLNLSKTKSIDFRVSTLPTLFGEKIVLRILDASAAKLGIDKLGYEENQKHLFVEGHSQALRHGAGHRPHRLGQDGVAIHGAQYPQHRRPKHLHRRGPGGNPCRGHQPGTAEHQARHDLRRRAALVPAPGPGHHHGRRNP